jgi:Predicted glycosyltransferases
MGAHPRIAVIVVTFNSARVLRGCLEALPAACAGSAWDLVIVDNASSDNSTALARSAAPQARVVSTGDNKGYAAGINAGVRACTDDVDAFLILNPDVRLEPGAAAVLCHELRRSRAGIAVPRLRDGAGRLATTLRREPTIRRAIGEAVLGGGRAGRITWLGEMITDARRYDRDCWSDWASGAAMLVSRPCFDAVGPWDESYFLYSEETDFCLRARDLGFRTRFVSTAGGVHLGGESGTSPELWSLLTANRVTQFARRNGRLKTNAFRAAVVLNELLRARRSATHRAALKRLLGGRGPGSAVRPTSRQSTSDA